MQKNNQNGNRYAEYLEGNLAAICTNDKKTIIPLFAYPHFINSRFGDIPILGVYNYGKIPESLHVVMGRSAPWYNNSEIWFIPSERAELILDPFALLRVVRASEKSEDGFYHVDISGREFVFHKEVTLMADIIAELAECSVDSIGLHSSVIYNRIPGISKEYCGGLHYILLSHSRGYTLRKKLFGIIRRGGYIDCSEDIVIRQIDYGMAKNIYPELLFRRYSFFDYLKIVHRRLFMGCAIFGGRKFLYSISVIEPGLVSRCPFALKSRRYIYLGRVKLEGKIMEDYYWWCYPSSVGLEINGYHVLTSGMSYRKILKKYDVKDISIGNIISIHPFFSESARLLEDVVAEGSLFMYLSENKDNPAEFCVVLGYSPQDYLKQKN